MDEIKSKERTIFGLEKELESTAGFLQKLQLQKDALDEQLFLVKEAECGLGSPKREIPGRAGDGAEHCGSPVSRKEQPGDSSDMKNDFRPFRKLKRRCAAASYVTHWLSMQEDLCNNI